MIGLMQSVKTDHAELGQDCAFRRSGAGPLREVGTKA